MNSIFHLYLKQYGMNSMFLMIIDRNNCHKQRLDKNTYGKDVT